LRLFGKLFRRREPQGGVVAFGGVVQARLVPRQPAKAETERQTAADELDALCERHGLTYDIERKARTVRINVTFENGDRMSAEGENVKAAVAALVARF
jgi:hypothetical protein